jgi:hypothetical protein
MAKSKKADIPWEQRTTVYLPEAAAVLSIGRTLAYSAAAAGDIPTLKFGTRVVVPVAWIKKTLSMEAA